MIKLRPHQQEVVNYSHGRMGVSAVPGSGKTHTLSYLAAKLISNGSIRDDQEILIVTLVNSAVDNFSKRITEFIKEAGLLPGMGYRVRTLHGLAHDIVRERPDLVGLSNQFTILDERETAEILRNVAISWLKNHPEFKENYLAVTEGNPPRGEVWEELMISMANSTIRVAKDLQITPPMYRKMMEDLGETNPLLSMGLDLYSDYQRALNYRGAVDFDDLIRLALQILQLDPEYLKSLRYRWPYILEDEAQDSSRLQEQILGLLAGQGGNWVRVGDPNQAIFETFTTASPTYLREFIRKPGVIARSLPNSGRSTRSIIYLANQLVKWARESTELDVALNEALAPTLIEPTPPGDPQPNPPDRPDLIHINANKLSPDEELNQIVRSLAKWLPEHQEETAVVLVSTNHRGAKIGEALRAAGLPVVEMLRSSQSTRQGARLFFLILHSLNEPSNSQKLAAAYKNIRVWKDDSSDLKTRVQKTEKLIQKCGRLEDYLAPFPGKDWLAALQQSGVDLDVLQDLEEFRSMMQRWQKAVLLPIDQLILTLAQDLFTEPSELALAHKLALTLERAASSHPGWHLPDYCAELESIMNNLRKFTGLSDDDTGFDPDAHKGEVAVATIHKAKGLEWDRVHISSVNNYDFPSAQAFDNYISEKWFIRGNLNLEAELIAKLQALADGDLVGLNLEEGIATRAARIDYSSERLRLLYVGITRARKQLIITTNSGSNTKARPALALVALEDIWREKNAGSH